APRVGRGEHRGAARDRRSALVSPHRPAWTAVVIPLLLLGRVAVADETEEPLVERPQADRPEIVNIAVPGHLVAGRTGTVRLTYRARRANVAAVVHAREDLDGGRRQTSQREISVVAAAFGREEGDLVLTLGFATSGRKRVTFTLLTDERVESYPESVDVDVAP